MNPRTEKAWRQVLWTVAHTAGADYGVLQRVERIGYRPGSFIEALLQAWLRADAGNTRRLDAAFPEYAAPMAMYRDDSLMALLAFCENAFADQGIG